MTEMQRPDGSGLSEGLGPLPEADYMTPVMGVLYSSASLRAYAAAAVAAEQKRWAVAVADMARSAADNNDLRVYGLLRALSDALYRA